MLDLLRKNTKKILWVIAAMFIVGIFFWYGSGVGRQNTVAEVGSQEVKLDEYRRTVMQQQRRIRENKEEELTEEDKINLKRDVLISLINQKIRYQEAKKMGIIVTEDEIINTIRNLPQFQQDEVFNYRLYEQSLKYSLDITPSEFEKEVKERIAIQKLERLILSSAKVTDKELKLYYLSNNDSIKGLKEKKDEIKTELLQKKRMALYNNWRLQLQQKYKTKFYPEVAGLES
ncbi:MAG: SurA N-terminal domain-containing protein [Elusimicrobiota bacterium]